MSAISLSLLGYPEITCNGRPLAFRTRKAQALLLYLVVEGGTLARARLVDLFWPEADAGKGRMMLRTTLSHLRQTLGAGGGPPGGDLSLAEVLDVQRDSLALHLPPQVYVDLHVVRGAVQSLAGTPPGMASEQQVMAQLWEAIRCYRDDFLASFTVEHAPEFDDWVIAQQEYWHQQMSRVLDGLSRLLSEEGEFGQALEVAERWVNHDPWSEAARERLMGLHVVMGNPAAARREYSGYRQLLAEELGTAPGHQLTDLAGRLERAEASTIPTSGKRLDVSKVPPAEQLVALLPMVGRERQLAGMVAAYRTACAGALQVIALAGPAGIGKTRLADEFLRWVAAEGGDILRGRALEARTGLPFHPIADALRGRLEQMNAPDDLLDDVWLSELSRLFPELRERYEDLPPAAADEATARSRLFEAVTRLVQALAGQAHEQSQGGLVLFLDDLQNADATSLDLLLYAARRWNDTRAPLLLLVAVRQDASSPSSLLAPPEAMTQWLSALERHVPLTRLLPPPLSAEQVTRMLEGLAGGTRVDPEAQQALLSTTGAWLLRETAGQPLFLAETLKLLLDHGLIVAERPLSGGWAFDLTPAARAIHAQTLASELPPVVRDVILARLASLGLPALQMLASAAVLGDPVTFDTMRQVAELSEDGALSALDELLRRDLLHLAGGNYFFGHDRVREVMYDEAGEARRRVYHRRALAVLEGSAPAAELARHAVAAGCAEKAFGYSLAAGDDALRIFATGDAARHYETAMRLTGSGAAGGVGKMGSLPLPTEDALVHLYSRLGRTHELREAWAPAENVYRDMVELGRRGDKPRLVWEGLNRMATLCMWAGSRMAEADELLRQAWGAAERSGDRLGMAETMWNRAQLGIYLYHSSAVADAQQALALARDLASPELIARCLNALAHAQTNHGRWEEAKASAEEAGRLYSGLGDWAMEVDCLVLLAMAQFNLGLVGDAQQAARQAYARALQAGTRWAQAFAGAVLAIILAQVGQYAEALAVGIQAVDLADQIGIPPLVRYARMGRASVEMAVGNSASAYADLQAAWSAHQMAGASAPMTDFLSTVLCAVSALKGEWPGALDFAQQAMAARDPATTVSAWSPLFLEVEALLRGGLVSQAEEDVVHLSKQVGTNPVMKLVYLRAHVVLCRHQGDLAGALCDLTAAQDLASTLGFPGEEWQISAERATLCEAAGDGSGAAAAHDRADALRRTLAASIEDPDLRSKFVEYSNAYPASVFPEVFGKS